MQKKGETVFQTLQLTTTFKMSKLLTYSFLVVHSSFLQKCRCLFYVNHFSLDLILEKLLCNLGLLIISLCNSFVIKRGFICSKIFLFDWSMFIKYIKYCFLEVTYAKLIKGEILNIAEFSTAKFFVIAICCNFW